METAVRSNSSVNNYPTHFCVNTESPSHEQNVLGELSSINQQDFLPEQQASNLKKAGCIKTRISKVTGSEDFNAITTNNPAEPAVMNGNVEQSNFPLLADEANNDKNNAATGLISPQYSIAKDSDDVAPNAEKRFNDMALQNISYTGLKEAELSSEAENIRWLLGVLANDVKGKKDNQEFNDICKSLVINNGRFSKDNVAIQKLIDLLKKYGESALYRFMASFSEACFAAGEEKHSGPDKHGTDVKQARSVLDNYQLVLGNHVMHLTDMCSSLTTINAYAQFFKDCCTALAMKTCSEQPFKNVSSNSATSSPAANINAHEDNGDRAPTSAGCHAHWSTQYISAILNSHLPANDKVLLVRQFTDRITAMNRGQGETQAAPVSDSVENGRLIGSPTVITAPRTPVTQVPDESNSNKLRSETEVLLHEKDRWVAQQPNIVDITRQQAGSPDSELLQRFAQFQLAWSKGNYDINQVRANQYERNKSTSSVPASAHGRGIPNNFPLAGEVPDVEVEKETAQLPTTLDKSDWPLGESDIEGSSSAEMATNTSKTFPENKNTRMADNREHFINSVIDSAVNEAISEDKTYSRENLNALSDAYPGVLRHG